MNNTTGVTSGKEINYPSEAPDFTSGFLWGSCCWIVSFLCSVLEIIVCPFVFFFNPLYGMSFNLLCLPCWYRQAVPTLY